MSGRRDVPAFHVPLPEDHDHDRDRPHPRIDDDPALDRPFDELKTRYPKVREPIVAALASLMQNPDIDAEHAKAVAAANGIRITAASIAGARRLLARQDGDGGPLANKPTRNTSKQTPPTTSRVRRPRTPTHVDPEALIRGVVAELQNAGNAEAERLRDAMKKAIAVLQAAVA